jgi:hypothetical protein
MRYGRIRTDKTSQVATGRVRSTVFQRFSLVRWRHGGFVKGRCGIPASRRCCRAGPARLAHCALYQPAFPYFLATGTTLAGAILVCDGWIIARRHWITGGLALATQIAFLIFVGTYTASPLLAPSPISDPLPQASPPGGMAIYALPTGVNHRTAAFAYRGGSPWDQDPELTSSRWLGMERRRQFSQPRFVSH